MCCFCSDAYQEPLAVHSSKQPPGSQSIIISERIAFLIVRDWKYSFALNGFHGPKLRNPGAPQKFTTLTQPFHEQVLPAGQPGEQGRSENMFQGDLFGDLFGPAALF